MVAAGERAVVISKARGSCGPLALQTVKTHSAAAAMVHLWISRLSTKRTTLD